MPKVILRGYIVVPDENLPEVLAELKHHKTLSRAEAGCLVFEVARREGQPNQFDVYEEFVDQAAFEKHQTRIKNSRWGKVSAKVERHYEIIRQHHFD